MDRLIAVEGLKIKAAAFVEQGQYQKAIFLAKKILENDARSLAALHLLAVCYMQMGKNEEAMVTIDEILAIDAEYMGAYLVLAHIHKRRFDLDKEIEVLEYIAHFLGNQQGNKVSLQEVQIYSEANSLLGSAYTLLGNHQKAMQYFLLSSRAEQKQEQKMVDYSNYLFVSNYDGSMHEQQLFEEHLRYNDFFEGIKRYQHRPRPDDGKIHIGYISPDFRYHAVAFFCRALLAKFDQEAFTVTCYALGGRDSVTLALEPLVSRWRDLRGVSADEAARFIHEDKIDILVDLSGHTAHNALPIMARKPAPVQVCGIGYFHTTGLKEIDYFLTDIYCDPMGEHDQYFTEKLLRLPASHLCYTPLGDMPECKTAHCEQAGYITFGSFNNFNKVTDETLRVWSEILQRVPKAKLVLKSKVFGSAFGRETAKHRLREAGIDRERAELRPFTSVYLTEYDDIDIALDTFPYPGGATTCEALYMGVPVVSLRGARHGARFGYSLLHNVGLEELVAADEFSYIEKAVALANDRELLVQLHRGLRPMMRSSSLMNETQYIDSIEKAYRTIWRQWQNADKPLVSILIPTYNRPHFFQIALESAVQQTYPNIEIIVCDNSTDDRTEMLMKSYHHDDRIRYLRNRSAKTKEENFRPFEKLAKGEYLQWLMDDDVLKPCKIEKMMRCFQESEDVTLVTSCRKWIDGEGAMIPNPAALSFAEECTILNGKSLGENMLTHLANLVGEPSAFLFRKRDLQHHYWNADCKGYKTISDVVMGLELLEKGNCGYFSEPLSAYRRHDGQEGQQKDVIVLSRLEWYRLVHEYYDKKIFLENRAQYEESLQSWLDDAKNLSGKHLSEQAERRALIEEYENKIAEAEKILRGASDEALMQEKLAAGDFRGMIFPLRAMLNDRPHDRDLLSKLTSAYIECGLASEARQTVERLIRIDPDRALTKFLQARVHYLCGDLVKAIEVFDGLDLADECGEDEVKSLLCNLAGNLFGLLGMSERSSAYYWQASRYSVGERNKAIDYSNYLFQLNYRQDVSQRELYQAHIGYNDLFREVNAYAFVQSTVNVTAIKKIKIGYLSPDFRQHVVTFFSYALFAAYDRERFEVICFSQGAEDEISEQLKTMVDGWVSLSRMGADEAAAVIHDWQLDILFDLSGHTKNNCLPILARCPAPVQICGIGYFNTTGLKAVDYFLTDIYCDPVGDNDAYFSEKLLRLPHSHLCYVPLHHEEEVNDAPCLRNGYVTFGSFNNFAKINDGVLLLWQEILHRLPESRLVLKSGVLGNEYALNRIKERFRLLDMPLDRIVFRGESYPYLHEYHDIDIALDPFPYPGGGTTCDALYMGVPVISLIGQRHGSRFGYSILKNVGLEELAATDQEEYVKKAVALAENIDFLQVLRKKLRIIMEKSDLMNMKQYMKEVEALYRQIYDRLKPK